MGQGHGPVALTGWGQEEDKRRSQEAGFDLHMVKPVDPAALRSCWPGCEPRQRDEADPRLKRRASMVLFAYAFKPQQWTLTGNHGIAGNAARQRDESSDVSRGRGSGAGTPSRASP